MGMQVDTVRKQGAGYNAQRMGKLENETEELSHAKVEGARYAPLRWHRVRAGRPARE